MDKAVLFRILPVMRHDIHKFRGWLHILSKTFMVEYGFLHSILGLVLDYKFTVALIFLADMLVRCAVFTAESFI